MATAARIPPPILAAAIEEKLLSLARSGRQDDLQKLKSLCILLRGCFAGQHALFKVPIPRADLYTFLQNLSGDRILSELERMQFIDGVAVYDQLTPLNTVFELTLAHA